MNDLKKEAGLPAPEFNTEAMFTITLQRPQKTSAIIEKTSEKTVEKTIIDLITDNPKTTTKNRLFATGLTRRGVEYQLKKLKETGKIMRIGSDIGGYWKVID